MLLALDPIDHLSGRGNITTRMPSIAAWIGCKSEWKEVIWWLMSLVPPPKEDKPPKYRSIDEE
jgi:hypothetical protein